ncbi:MAG: glycine--tRNA ligase subunit beta [Actinobacteria bacterium]|nr:glycine--tRNA ligase subunit beta [Actinomycetota bacterium]
MGKDLVLEIGTEELPPSCIRDGAASFKALLEKNLTSNRIDFGEVSVFHSPRRMIAYIKDLCVLQKSEEKIVTGPPKNISIGPDGGPNQAACGFAESLGIGVEDLEDIEIKGKGIYLGKKMIQEGKNTAEILPGILKDTILSITFKKQMYWADYQTRFVRPIRWILALFGGVIIKFVIENVVSDRLTYGHRTLNTSPIRVEDASGYFQILEKDGNAIADPQKRRDMIRSQIKNIEKHRWKGSCRALVDEKLLEEVVDLVEIPNVLVGGFPSDFLYIPADILIEAIQYHQKYFPVIDDNGKVITDFLIVQNGISDNGDVKKGNERVLKARLSDAAFFYEQDRKHDFSYWEKKLEGVIFYSGLGNMNDKQKRLKDISLYIVGKLGKKLQCPDGTIQEDLVNASGMCKCDLVANLVVEFPELQGVVGREYSKERGYTEAVSSAVFEHYLPRFAGDSLPETETGRILSLADKIDTISGMFMVGNIPSGSEDPFALRRKASGIVRSVLESGYDIDLRDLIGFAMGLYSDCFELKKSCGDDTIEKIFDFIIARFRFLLEGQDRRMDILEAVLGSGCGSITDIDMRFKAIKEYILNNDIKSIIWPMSRSQNIIAKKQFGSIDSGLFIEEQEKKLFNSLKDIEKKASVLIEKRDYTVLLAEMEKFGKVVDAFFDKVLVMDRDPAVKTNRINMLKEVADYYLRMADFSKLVIESN